MAWKVDEAVNFVFVQLTEQEPDVYDKYIYDECHPDYTSQANINLAWEGIYHETKESGVHVKFFRNNISASV
jgi:hypothetical protein